MDNEGYQRDLERGAALEMKSTTKGTSTLADNKPLKSSNNHGGHEHHSNNNSHIDHSAGKSHVTNYPKLLGGSNYNTLPSTSCKPEVCQEARRRYAPPDLSGNPWHRYKTIFLLSMLILLALWIVIYATLDSLKIL